MRKAFRVLNKAFMVPAFRLGLGAIINSPYGGYIMVIKARGRKTGKPRYTPVNYAIDGGYVYALAGYGGRSHWVRNLLADPQAELILPGRALACQAVQLADPDERTRILRQILINSGFATYLFGGINPHHISDAKLREVTKDYLVLQFRPTGVASGPADPGGWFWVWPTAAILLAIWLLLR